MRILKIFKIIRDDKKLGIENRHNRADEINQLLKLNKYYYTKPLITQKCNTYVVEYKRPQFWYDNESITIKNILNKVASWHVSHWLVYASGSKCGFSTSIVYGIFSKKNIYIWLERESKRVDRL